MRVQRVYLTDDSRDFLFSMLHGRNHHLMEELDQKFIKELLESATLSIKDIERYIKRRIDEIQAAGGLNVSYAYKAKLSNINMLEGKATLQIEDDKGKGKVKVKEKTYEFNYIVGADGHNHHAANVYNASSAKKIKYKKDISPKTKNNISLYITIESKDSKDSLQIPKDKSFLFAAKDALFLYAISLDLHSYEKSKHQKIKCSISAEIPIYLKGKSDAELLTYLRPLVTKYIHTVSKNNENLQIHIIPSKKSGLQKDKLKFQHFSIEVEQAIEAAVRDEKSSNYFIGMGDAIRSPVYHFGHGVNDAFLQAHWFSAILLNQLSIKQYNNYCSIQAKEITKLLPILNGSAWFTFSIFSNRYKSLFVALLENTVDIDFKAWRLRHQLQDRLSEIYEILIKKRAYESPEIEKQEALSKLINERYKTKSKEKFLTYKKSFEDQVTKLEKAVGKSPEEVKQRPKV